MSNIKNSKKNAVVVNDDLHTSNDPFVVDPTDINDKDLDLDNGMSENRPSVISLEKLSEFDLHSGLKANFWNPKMEDFIYKKKNNRHIIDIRKSIYFLNKAYFYMSDLVKAGIDIMFVSVKNKNISHIVKDAAKRVNGYYITQRWLGGLLTNFGQISKTIKKLNDLEELLGNKELSSKYTKKELVYMTKEKNKLEKFYSGIKNLTKLPSLMFLFTLVEDSDVVLEAIKMVIPIVCFSNTNTNPDLIDFIITGNKRSAKSFYLIANLLCDVIPEVNWQSTLIACRDNKNIAFPEEYIRIKNIQNKLQTCKRKRWCCANLEKKFFKTGVKKFCISNKKGINDSILLSYKYIHPEEQSKKTHIIPTASHCNNIHNKLKQSLKDFEASNCKIDPIVPSFKSLL